MKFIHFLTRSCSAILISALAMGCTEVKTASIHPTVLPLGHLLPHHVALVLNEDLANYKHEQSVVGGKVVIRLGDSLQAYARQIAANSFQQVDVVSSVEQAVALKSADLILIPQAIKSDMSIPVYGFEKVNFTLVVSWTAKNRTTQNIIWLQTITATGQEKKWRVNFQSDDKLYQNIFDDLSIKTFNAIQVAPEFRSSDP